MSGEFAQSGGEQVAAEPEAIPSAVAAHSTSAVARYQMKMTLDRLAMRTGDLSQLLKKGTALFTADQRTMQLGDHESVVTVACKPGDLRNVAWQLMSACRARALQCVEESSGRVIDVSSQSREKQFEKPAK